jgi:hydroxyacylglutathione hydrolase
VRALRDKNQPTLPSFLSEEKLTNPFLMCEKSELIKRVESHAGKTLNMPVDVFAALRKWKDSF